jgi:hypothetical protein
MHHNDIHSIFFLQMKERQALLKLQSSIRDLNENRYAHVNGRCIRFSLGVNSAKSALVRRCHVHVLM